MPLGEAAQPPRFPIGVAGRPGAGSRIGLLVIVGVVLVWPRLRRCHPDGQARGRRGISLMTGLSTVAR
jgi:hypothetical protein